MGKVAITFRLMPEGPETSIEKIEEEVKKALGESFKTSEARPFAFGLDALFVIAVVQDEQGAAERLESSLSRIEGVQTVETVELDLI